MKVFIPTYIGRIRPTTSTCAWDNAAQSIKLQPQYAKSSASAEYNFDEILTGSENKPVYNAVARGHVCAAMDGYNAVIFAYGQTASGKTFTLVRLLRFPESGSNILINNPVRRPRPTRNNPSLNERRICVHPAHTRP